MGYSASMPKDGGKKSLFKEASSNLLHTIAKFACRIAIEANAMEKLEIMKASIWFQETQT